MRSLAALVVTLSLIGCSRDDARDSTPQRDAPPREAAVSAPADGATRSGWWEARSEFPAQRGTSLFEGRDTTRAQIRHRPPPEREAMPVPGVAQGPPLPPYTYVGKVARGGEGYAVLARDERVFVVGVGDAVGNGYRVRSISEREVVLFNLDFDMTRKLAYSAAASNAVLPADAALTAASDDVSLRISGPSQVAVGEQFTLTVSLDSGFSAALESGKVEVRFDPKVLEIVGESASSGAARVEIGGAYVGHPAPATLQFRAHAAAPGGTEVRVVPTSIADTDGRNLGVNVPQPYRLMVVRAAAGAPDVAFGSRGRGPSPASAPNAVLPARNPAPQTETPSETEPPPQTEPPDDG